MNPRKAQAQGPVRIHRAPQLLEPRQSLLLGVDPPGHGERQARHLGFEPARLRRRLLIAIAMLVGPLVAVIGGVAFIGLVVPHMLRMRVGADHRVLLPLSWFGGATVLVLADWIARTAVAPAELPVGVVTSLVGGPFFMWLLTRTPRSDLSD